MWVSFIRSSRIWQVIVWECVVFVQEELPTLEGGVSLGLGEVIARGCGVLVQEELPSWWWWWWWGGGGFTRSRGGHSEGCGIFVEKELLAWDEFH